MQAKFSVLSVPPTVVSNACVRVRRSEPYIYIDINGDKVWVIFKEGEIRLFCKRSFQISRHGVIVPKWDYTKGNPPIYPVLSGISLSEQAPYQVGETVHIVCLVKCLMLNTFVCVSAEWNSAETRRGNSTVCLWKFQLIDYFWFLHGNFAYMYSALSHRFPPSQSVHLLLRSLSLQKR